MLYFIFDFIWFAYFSDKKERKRLKVQLWRWWQLFLGSQKTYFFSGGNQALMLSELKMCSFGSFSVNGLTILRHSCVNPAQWLAFEFSSWWISILDPGLPTWMWYYIFVGFFTLSGIGKSLKYPSFFNSLGYHQYS